LFQKGFFPRTPIVIPDLKRGVIYYNSSKYKLNKHQFWYLAPKLTSWKESDGPVDPLMFAYLLHNTKYFKGLTPLMSDLNANLDLKTMKSGGTKLAEELLEKVRQEKYPEKPSRMKCHFLNFSKESGAKRQTSWGTSFSERRLERCFIVESTGPVHWADVTIFEKLCSDPMNVALAESYWNQFFPKDDKEKENLEILGDCNLYFPEWSAFPAFNMQDLGKYNKRVRQEKSRLKN
jgi:hypothetical protein